MNFPRTISAACQYLAAHPELHADPALLLAACEQWSEVMILKLDADASICPTTRDIVESALHQAGINAAREVAMPVRKKVVIKNLINPEDLTD